MTDPVILSLDAGTTSTRAVAFTLEGQVLASASRPITQYFPQPGWVEQDADEIAIGTIAAAREVIAQVGGARIAGIGITNQRETIVFWDAKTLKPVGKAIVWQDRRTADLCRTLREAGHEPMVQAKTGLLLDPYFSGTKIQWRLNQDAELAAAARRGTVRIGTIDSYLVARLSGGAHVSDATNASRTLLYDIGSGQWDETLLDLMHTPRAALPEVVDSAGIVAASSADVLGLALPIAGIAGDQ
jgi:glycerol kinase